MAALHSQTTWSVVGNTGVALAALATCLFATARLTRARWLGAP
ncbi:hypothetical protein [Streptomyces sp. NPDC002088]